MKDNIKIFEETAKVLVEKKVIKENELKEVGLVEAIIEEIPILEANEEEIKETESLLTEEIIASLTNNMGDEQ